MDQKTLLDKQLNAAKECYKDAVFAVDDAQDFIPKEILNQRKYVKYIDSIKSYIDLGEAALSEENKRGFISKIIGTSTSMDLVDKFEIDNAIGEKLEQIKICSKCACFKCARDCRMESCNRCETGCGCHISSCDNTTSVYLIRNKKLELHNDKTDKLEIFNVLGIVQDLQYTTFYIVLELNGEKVILYYYPGISEDTYGEIKDVEDFNFAYKAFDQACQ